MQISSMNNPTIKHIRSLVRQRKEREQHGVFFIEGIRLVTEAVQLRAPIETLVIAPDLLISPCAQEIVQAQQQAGTPCLEVTSTVFKSISAKDGPQGIGAIVRQRWEHLKDMQVLHSVDEQQSLGWVALDAIQDPGNLGTIMRTSDAVGGAGIILLGHTTDPYDPAALRASMGAIFSQRLARATFTELIDWKKQHGYPVVGTSDSAATDYQELVYHTPLVLLMGSERAGLSPEQQAQCDDVVCIPMVGRSDSLNLAVATGVMLYEILNRNRRA